jgi:hypothetical protein
MAGLPLSGPITLASIRGELGLADTNFSLDTAENGQYVTINPCSQYKPALANPTSLSEWYGYNHKAACNSYEFQAVITDIGTAGSCDQTFNVVEARNNINVYYPTWIINIGTDPSINRLVIRNIEKFPAIRVEVKGVINGIVSLIYAFEGNGASYTPWNLVPNTGSWGAVDIKSTYVYTLSIWYNDGSNRTISNQRIILTNPPADGYYTTPTYYSATAGTVCSVTSLTNYVTFEYPFVVGAQVVYQDETSVPDGYYRMMYDPSKIYQVVGESISAITNC